MTKITKITRATIKSFIKKNFSNLFIRNISDFDGMIDGMKYHNNAKFRKAISTDRDEKYTFGIDGAYILPSRNLFKAFENEEYIGFNVWNCCGEFDIVIKK